MQRKRSCAAAACTIFLSVANHVLFEWRHKATATSFDKQQFPLHAMCLIYSPSLQPSSRIIIYNTIATMRRTDRAAESWQLLRYCDDNGMNVQWCCISKLYVGGRCQWLQSCAVQSRKYMVPAPFRLDANIIIIIIIINIIIVSSNNNSNNEIYLLLTQVHTKRQYYL